jgi:hypothetical protein
MGLLFQIRADLSKRKSLQTSRDGYGRLEVVEPVITQNQVGTQASEEQKFLKTIGCSDTPSPRLM